MKKDLEKLRKQIDNIDNSIVNLLAERKKIVKKVGQLKKQHNVPPFDQVRWEQVIISKMKKAKSLGLNLEVVKKIYNIIHEEALKIEKLI